MINFFEQKKPQNTEDQRSDILKKIAAAEGIIRNVENELEITNTLYEEALKNGNYDDIENYSEIIKSHKNNIAGLKESIDILQERLKSLE